MLLKQLVGNEKIGLISSFFDKQSWEHLRKTELILGYDDIVFQVNKNFRSEGLTINNLYQTKDNEFHVLVVHEQIGEIDLLIAIDDFTLISEKAQMIFSFSVENIKPFATASFFYKMKIFAANIIMKFFSDTVTNKIFNNKDFGEGITSVVVDKKIKLSFHEFINNSSLGKKVLGFGVLDFIHIIALNPSKNGFAVRFNFEAPEWFKSFAFMLFNGVAHYLLSKVSIPGKKRKMF